jgi:hypothetical protein
MGKAKIFVVISVILTIVTSSNITKNEVEEATTILNSSVTATNCSTGTYAVQERCDPCDCDQGGSYDNNCNLLTGQCRCLHHVVGRRCDTPESLYFSALLDHLRYEAESARGNKTHVSKAEPPSDYPATWTGIGFMSLGNGSSVEIDIDNIPRTMEYDIYIRYAPSRHFDGQPLGANITIQKVSNLSLNSSSDNPSNIARQVRFPANKMLVTPINSSALLKKGMAYIIKLEVFQEPSYRTEERILLDSIVLVPKVDKIPFFSEEEEISRQRLEEFKDFGCLDVLSVVKEPFYGICKTYLNSIGLWLFDGAQECSCHPIGSESFNCDPLGGQCPCKENVIGRTCDMCSTGYFGFGAKGCKRCDCSRVGTINNLCNSTSGECVCQNGYSGFKCDVCSQSAAYRHYPVCL